MQRLLTVILACLGMIGALAIDTYLPSMPAIGVEFDVGPVAVQQTLSVFLFCFAFMMLFYGTLSDSVGRRPVILAALSVYTLASVGAAFAPSFGALLACRALQGLSAGAGSVIGQAIVQDRFAGSQAQKIMSHIMMVFGLAPSIAPVLGGWLHVSFGWRSTFIFLAIFGTALILLCLRLLPESLPRETRQVFHPVTIGRNYLMVLRRPQFVLLSLGSIAVTVVLFLSWLLRPHPRAWRPFILVASWVFYGWLDWRWVLLLIGSTVVNTVLANAVARADGQVTRKQWVTVAVALNLALLATFKYLGFFVGSVDDE